MNLNDTRSNNLPPSAGATSNEFQFQPGHPLVSAQTYTLPSSGPSHLNYHAPIIINLSFPIYANQTRTANCQSENVNHYTISVPSHQIPSQPQSSFDHQQQQPPDIRSASIHKESFNQHRESDQFENQEVSYSTIDSTDEMISSSIFPSKLPISPWKTIDGFKVLVGNRNQYDPSFKNVNQCTGMAAGGLFMKFLIDIENLNAQIMDSFLDFGDEFYLKSAESVGKSNGDLISPCHLLPQFSVDHQQNRQHYQLLTNIRSDGQRDAWQYGNVLPRPNSALPNLLEAITQLFNTTEFEFTGGILVCKNKSRSIFSVNSKFYLFDSHDSILHTNLN